MVMTDTGDSSNNRPPNFRDADEGKLYLVRCFVCAPGKGRENYALNVSSGVCTWCGWSDRNEKKDKALGEADHAETLEEKP